MDNYTKMCEAATEIQNGWVPKVGDRYYYYRGGDNIKIVDENTIWNKEVILKRILGEVYCPSIEQLMEMVVEDFSAHQQNNRFRRFLRGYRTKGDDSIRELWLAFVMREKFSKKWSGSEWEKDE